MPCQRVRVSGVATLEDHAVLEELAAFTEVVGDVCTDSRRCQMPLTPEEREQIKNMIGAERS